MTAGNASEKNQASTSSSENPYAEVGSESAQPPAERPESKSGPKRGLALGIAGVVAVIALIGAVWATSGSEGEEPTAGPTTTITAEPTHIPGDLSKPVPPGTYVVGKDFPAGLYVFQATDKGKDGFFRISGNGDGNEATIDREYFSNNSYRQLEEGWTVEVRNATLWLPDKAPKVDARATSAEFRVGVDIEPGVYVVSATGGVDAFLKTRSDAGVNTESTLRLEILEGATYVEVVEGDYLRIHNSILTPAEKAGKIKLSTRGIYKVGHDIEAGRYVVDNVDAQPVHWIKVLNELRDSDSSGLISFEGAEYMDLEAGTYVELRDVNLTLAENARARTPGDNVGMFLVGKDIEPGTYLYTLQDESETDANLAIANSLEDFENYANVVLEPVFSQFYVTLEEGQFVRIRVKGTLVREADAAPISASVGMLKVGKDIPAGEYKIVATDQVSRYLIYKDATFKESSLMSSNFVSGEATVTLEDGQYINIVNGQIVR